MERTYKILKEGPAKFYIKSVFLKSKMGGPLVTSKGDPYISMSFKVTDSNGESENVSKMFVLKYKRELEKLFNAIGKSHWVEKIQHKAFPWDSLEDQDGFCRLVTEKATGAYPARTIIESFVKTQESDKYLDQKIAALSDDEGAEAVKSSAMDYFGDESKNDDVPF